MHKQNQNKNRFIWKFYFIPESMDDPADATFPLSKPAGSNVGRTLGEGGLRAIRVISIVIKTYTPLHLLVGNIPGFERILGFFNAD